MNLKQRQFQKKPLLDQLIKRSKMLQISLVIKINTKSKQQMLNELPQTQKQIRVIILITITCIIIIL